MVVLVVHSRVSNWLGTEHPGLVRFVSVDFCWISLQLPKTLLRLGFRISFRQIETGGYSTGSYRRELNHATNRSA